MLRWLLVLLLPLGGKGGVAARKLMELLAGVRRTSIEAGRYKVGWTRLSTGERKRRAAESAAGTGKGSLGRGASSGAAGDGDCWGPDNAAGQMPPHHVLKRGVSPPAPLLIVVYSWTAMARMVGIRSRRVIGGFGR